MKKLLVVVDMQNDFIDGALGTKEATEILPKVIEKIKNHEGEVIYTRDTHGDTYLETQEGKNLSVIHCIKYSKGWELEKKISELCRSDKGKIFDKNTFASMEMVKYIGDICNENNVQQIEVIGLCTDICVISNVLVLKAAVPEIKIIVDSSCCAGVTRESHNNALRAMNMCHIEII